MKRLLHLCLLMAPAGLVAETCPQPPDHSRALNSLIEQVQKAPDENSARHITNQMWAFWAEAPDEAAQAILDRGMQKRAGWDFLGAIEDFDKLIAYCPNYAEGYNQRAFVNFLRQDFAAALPDLERAIALSPRHIGALSGRAITLIGLGRDEDAQKALADALALNPWLPERSLLREGGTASKPEGTDL